MVSTPSILCMVITLLISLILPLVIILVLCIKRKIHIIPVLVGAGVFFLFQMILRIPALQIGASLSPEFAEFISTPVLGGLFLGLTAGIFEEFGRYIGYRTLLRRRNAWTDGLAFGLGHGGIEAILLVGLSYVNNLIYAFIINSGNWGTVSALLPAETALQMYNALVYTPSYQFLIGGVERIFAMTIQIALSLLVLYGIRKRRFVYVLLAVFLHLLVDSPVVFLMQKVGIWWTELYVFVCALAALVYIIYSRKAFAKLDDTQPAMQSHPVPDVPAQPE